jgi:3'-phosphoadenosine 5'-phosphosulfate sulfotransferase (PAPS reductase)/FAD synthetase
MHKADAKARIQSCFERNDGVIYLAYSGGRDSNVVLSLCRTYFPNTSRVLVTKTEMFFPEVGKLIQEVSKTEKIFFNYTD